MKLSISLSDDDIAVVDEYARTAGLRTRSAVLQYAVGLLRNAHLERDYASAWDEWESSGDHAAWESTVGDGLTDATR